VGAAKKPLLLVVAAAIILTHSLIAHKEYRFIVPAIACLIVLAGLGLAECVAALNRRVKAASDSRRLLPGALLLFALTSFAVARSADGQARLTAGRNWRDAFAALSADPSLCGIGLIGNDWTKLPGYSALHRPVPIYFRETLKSDDLRQAANVLVSEGHGTGSPDSMFSEATCFQQPGNAWPEVCVYRRPGTCTAAPALDINAELIRRDE
jgi:phosphatidylinositol glycan class B